MLTVAVTAAAQAKHEIRAVWLTTLGGLDWPTTKATSPERMEMQKRELIEILDRLKAANFNTVLFQARIRGDVAYRSDIEAFSEAFTGQYGKDPGYDPLAFALEECHKRGMELHAWVIAIPIGNDSHVRHLGSRHVVRQHPSICKKYHNTWYLDPGNPATDDYLASIVREIVSRYDIDGIHLDYIRYPEHSHKFPDKATYKKYGGRQETGQWRRDNISRIVARVHAETKALKPWVKVSSSPVGKHRDLPRYSSVGWNAYEIVSQDAQHWLEAGIQDVLFPMMYFQDNQFYPFALDWQENSHGRFVVPGLGIYFLDPREGKWKVDEVVRQLHFLREIKADGQAYFRNRFLMDNVQGLMTEIELNVYTHPAVWPPMTWLDSIPPTTPSSPSLSFGGDGMTSLRWSASTDNSEPYQVSYRIYASDSYPVDIDRAENIVADRVGDTRFSFTPRVPWQQRTYWAVTAVDRYGNESKALEMNVPRVEGVEVLESIPAPPEGGMVVISDITGREVLRSQSAVGVLERLAEGFYRVSIDDGSGSVRPVGVMVK